MNLETRETLIKTFLPTVALVLLYIWIVGGPKSKELNKHRTEASRLQSTKQVDLHKKTVRAKLTNQRREMKVLTDDLQRLINNHPSLIEKTAYVMDGQSTKQVESLTAFMTSSGLRVIEDGPVQRRGQTLPIYLEPHQGIGDLEKKLVKSKLDSSILQVSEGGGTDSAASRKHLPKGLLWRVELAGSYGAMQRMLEKLNGMPAVVPHAIHMVTPLNKRILEVKEDRASTSAVKSTNKVGPNETHWVIELWI